MADHRGGNEAERGALPVAENFAQVIVLLLEITKSIILGSQFPVLGENTVVLGLKLIKGHQVLAETADGAFHRATGTADRGEQSEQSRLEV